MYAADHMSKKQLNQKDHDCVKNILQYVYHMAIIFPGMSDCKMVARSDSELYLPDLKPYID